MVNEVTGKLMDDRLIRGVVYNIYNHSKQSPVRTKHLSFHSGSGPHNKAAGCFS